jgi:hypothetical protein
MHDELKHKYSLPWRFKKAWIKALKSGDYIQGTGTLREQKEITPTGNNKISYCCLGVACIVAGIPEEFIDGEWIEYQQDGFDYEKVPEVLHGVADSNELAKVLSEMNDNCNNEENRHEFSFNDIADWIDDNIKTTR